MGTHVGFVEAIFRYPVKAIVRANGNNAGVCGTVTRVGRLAVGQAVYRV
ncbi:hypothetical protein [Luteitalea sp.]|nr:hypothetical protein [Luteitalea sp.]